MSIQESILQAIKTVEKQFGKGSLMAMGGTDRENVVTFPSGSLLLDRGLGIGGIPRGRIIEVFGQESSGKTTLALHMIAQAQKAGLVTAFLDAEHALDIGYARRLGVNVDELLVSQPDYGEQALEIASVLTQQCGVGFIVVDSVAALVPKAELEGEMGDQHVGLQARLMSQALRKLAAVCNRNGTTILFINQIRMKIGVMFGNPETTTGGNALKFFSSVRIEVRKGQAIKDGEGIKGNKIRLKVVKNKLAPPFAEIETDLVWGKGINRTAELLELAVNQGIVQKAGSWYSLDGERMGQGAEQAVGFLEDHPDISDSLTKRLAA
jgi:recombination protein RecA